MLNVVRINTLIRNSFAGMLLNENDNFMTFLLFSDLTPSAPFLERNGAINRKTPLSASERGWGRGFS
jgi:hypothetical protein